MEINVYGAIMLYWKGFNKACKTFVRFQPVWTEQDVHEQ